MPSIKKSSNKIWIKKSHRRSVRKRRSVPRMCWQRFIVLILWNTANTAKTELNNLSKWLLSRRDFHCSLFRITLCEGKESIGFATSKFSWNVQKIGVSKNFWLRMPKIPTHLPISEIHQEQRKRFEKLRITCVTLFFSYLLLLEARLPDSLDEACMYTLFTPLVLCQ